MTTPWFDEEISDELAAPKPREGYRRGAIISLREEES